MKKISKTPLFSTLKKALALALETNRLDTSVEETFGHVKETNLSRRRFLESSGKIAAAGALSGFVGDNVFADTLRAQAQPKIAIIGAGLAGLSALHTLKKLGFDATLYEASSRAGGRVYTVHNAMGKGTWTEFGAEFIDTNHRDMWNLANEFKLKLIDYGQKSEEKLTKEVFFFEGQSRTLAEVVTAFRGFANQIKADADKLPDNLSYKTTDPAVIKLDQMSLSEYLESIGATGWIKRFIEVAYESEYGLSPQVQSAINLIILISTDTTHGFELFGESDERYKVRGGNQSIPTALATKYHNHIEINRSLEAIYQVGTQYYLKLSGLSATVKADFVIITIPFSRLRQVDFPIRMSPIKRVAIDTLGFGTNSKLMLGMKSHFWRTQGYQGLCYSDNGIPNGWDNSQLQTPDNGPAGLSILFGGASGLAVGAGLVSAQKDNYLPKWEQIFPGAIENFNGKARRMHWPSYRYTLGSYICYTTGQYTTISGIEVMPIGNILFAGEHCGGEFAGFMNGAAQSGRLAALNVIKRIRRLPA